MLYEGGVGHSWFSLQKIRANIERLLDECPFLSALLSTYRSKNVKFLQTALRKLHKHKRK